MASLPGHLPPNSANRPLVKYALLLPLALVLLALAALVGIDSEIGHRALADWLSSQRAANGLAISVGRINGSVFGAARLDGVALRDDRGVFLTVPEADLDWRPIAWLANRLDIRALVLRRGTLLRVPALRPGIPNGPILPGFDIRVDRLQIERLTVAAGIAGPQRRIDLTARADIHHRRAMLTIASRLGGADRLAGLVDADEAAGRFALALDYAAPKGGLLAGLTGATASRLARIDGRGSWTNWRGALVATQDERPLASLTLVNHAGRYGLAGEVRPAPLLSAADASLIGPVVALAGEGRLADGGLAGRLTATSANFHAIANGGYDLHGSGFRATAVDAEARGELQFGKASLAGVVAHLVLDGPPASIVARGTVAASQIHAGANIVQNLTAAGTARRVGLLWQAPLQLTAARIVTGQPALDTRLVRLHGGGTFTLVGPMLAADGVSLAAPGLMLSGKLRGDLARGGYGFSGRLAGSGLPLGGAGLADATATGTLALAAGGGWRLGAQVNGRAHPANPSLIDIAGAAPSFAGAVSGSSGQPWLVSRGSLSSDRLALAFTGSRTAAGVSVFSGAGRQASYGPFTLSGSIAADGPHATLVLADPWPAGKVSNMQLAIAPDPVGYAITTSGGSALGPFAGVIGLGLPAGAPARLDIRHFTVSQTAIAGGITFLNGVANGALTLAGGGISGQVRLAGAGAGQGIDAHLTAQNARFAGDMPLLVASGDFTITGLLQRQHTQFTLAGQLRGLRQGSLTISRGAVKASLHDGSGNASLAIIGQRGSRFALNLGAEFTPARIQLAANGNFGGDAIAMPRRAVLTRLPGRPPLGGGWQLAPTELDIGKGRAVASGSYGGAGTTVALGLADMPLTLGDAFSANLGLAGTVSGNLAYAAVPRAAPTGSAQLLIHGLTRSSALLTSRPIDLALVGRLAPADLQLRAVASGNGSRFGQIQARVTGLAAGGPLIDRLRAGALAASMRYSGPADAAWRLLAVDAFDLSGPLVLAADVTGSIDVPAITGNLAGDNLRLQSGLTGTDVTGMAVRGHFAGSRLTLGSFSGQTARGGTVVGSGWIDFVGLSQLGAPVMDLRLGMRRAALINRTDMALTATGPMRIVSDGVQGTIAGRLAIDVARWRLGQASSAATLPVVATREINLAQDLGLTPSRSLSWRLLVDAAGPGNIRVTGLGLDSQWGAQLQLRGPVLEPEITGEADMVGGSYEFAGQHFDLTRGSLIFDGTAPPDPQVDIVASNSANGITATVTVRGSSLTPRIAFSSQPPMPEQQLLARLLFGEDISAISAPEALQLASALAALHGSGGLDPINRLRSAIGLDRLRVVSADPTVPHQTGVAVGKNIGRRLYAELITDGHGYSATSLEFRITRWLSVLASVSTIGRQSVNARVSHDY